MAARTITTKLALEGEAEYRAQLQRINAELRLHKSELEKVQAEYAGQLNSLEALGRESEFGEITEARHGADGFFRSEHIALADGDTAAEETNMAGPPDFEPGTLSAVRAEIDIVLECIDMFKTRPKIQIRLKPADPSALHCFCLKHFVTHRAVDRLIQKQTFFLRRILFHRFVGIRLVTLLPFIQIRRLR